MKKGKKERVVRRVDWKSHAMDGDSLPSKEHLATLGQREMTWRERKEELLGFTATRAQPVRGDLKESHWEHHTLDFLVLRALTLDGDGGIYSDRGLRYEERKGRAFDQGKVEYYLAWATVGWMLVTSAGLLTRTFATWEYYDGFGRLGLCSERSRLFGIFLSHVDWRLYNGVRSAMRFAPLVTPISPSVVTTDVITIVANPHQHCCCHLNHPIVVVCHSLMILIYIISFPLAFQLRQVSREKENGACMSLGESGSENPSHDKSSIGKFIPADFLQKIKIETSFFWYEYQFFILQNFRRKCTAYFWQKIRRMISPDNCRLEHPVDNMLEISTVIFCQNIDMISSYNFSDG
ncbi:hypothetical protein IEQ34_021608 [Dendrobium chrysotoxum]|uniref:Uncharacterized protein n=1 Tax=Dendrobium chrysotoxum TaxID=161865 RepID=A0AAV7G3E2_DENCH|nr:hypothetical protein IEQ34_021608 [Dendrobium chrysotoxum]